MDKNIDTEIIRCNFYFSLFRYLHVKVGIENKNMNKKQTVVKSIHFCFW